MSRKELEGRTALVTGGARGIGRAICVRLAQEGARVAINYAGNEAAAKEAERLVRAEGAECLTVQADVSDPDAVAAMVAKAEDALGPIDLLVTSAGIAPSEQRGTVPFETWRRIMAVNLDGTYPADHGREGRHDRARLRSDRLLRLDRRASAATEHARLRHLEGRGHRLRAQLLRGVRAGHPDQLHRARTDRHRDAGRPHSMKRRGGG